MNENKPNEIDSELVTFASSRRKKWLWNFRIWSFIYYCFVAIGTALTIIAAAGTGELLLGFDSIWCSIIGSIAFAIVVAFNPKEKAQRFHKAASLLDEDAQKYRFGELEKEKLLKSISISEKLGDIHNSSIVLGKLFD